MSMVGWNGLQWKFLIHLDFHKIIPKHLTFKETNLEKHIGMKIRMHLEKWFQPMVKWFISMFLRTICKGGYNRVSVQGVKLLGGHFACLCRGFDFYEVKKKCYYFSKRKWKYFYTFHHFYSEKSSKRAK